MARKRHIQKCIGCGKCCGHYLPLTDEDIRQVFDYTEKHGIEPQCTGIDCPWLADNNTCAIYEARPSICRAYHCDARKAGHLAGSYEQYHIYNTERLFIEGDRTQYDYLIELSKALGGSSFEILFDAREKVSE